MAAPKPDESTLFNAARRIDDWCGPSIGLSWTR
jgi:hypothetical protein